MRIKHKPYHVEEEGLVNIEEYYKAKFIGAWCIKDRFGNWNKKPVDVFFQPEPNLQEGHSHYFGVFKEYGETGKLNMYICDAQSAFSEPIYGVLCDDGEVLVSRYCDDLVEKEGHMICGGREYTERSLHSKLIEISVHNGEFLMNEV